MTVPTTAEKALLRSRPHATKLYLSIYQPKIALACRVNEGGIAKGERDITYDTVSSGNYLLVESGMTALVGTTLGGDEKGRIRVKSATSSVLTMAENDHINWADDDYITVLRFIEIEAIFPRIIDPDSDGDTVWYKDYDVAYTNQNDILGSLVCMEDHFAGFLSGTGTCSVYYSASGTYNMLGSTLSYYWFFEGATVTGSNLHTPGYIDYLTPGHYTTRLIVSGSAGEGDKSYRHISIYDKPEAGTNVPILQWEMDELSGSRDSGGYTTTIRVYENTAKSLVKDNALVVIFAEDTYGTTKQSIGGSNLNRSSIFFVGYILEGSIKYNYASSYVEFKVGSPTEVMKKVEGFSVAANSSANPTSQAATDEDIPSAWVLIKDMDVRRGLYHYLRWHSTILLCTDVEFKGTDKKVQYMDTDRTSLYDAAQSWINGTLLGDIVSDRQGKLWAEVSVGATNLASGSFPTSLVLEKWDWINEPDIDEAQYNELAFLELGGFAYSGATTGTTTPLLSQAPGTTPDYEGGLEQIEGLVISSQSDLNTLSGNIFAHKNARYPNISIELAGNYRNFDIAPQEFASLKVSATDTNRGIVFDEKPFYIIGLAYNYNPRFESLLPTMDVREVTQGFAGDTVVIPEEAPGDNDYGDDGIVIPPLPPLPPIVEPPTPSDEHPPIAYMIGWKYIGGGNGLTDTTAANYKQIIAKSTNFNTTSPNWVDYLSSAAGSPPSGTFIDYVEMADTPAQGGYWLTQYGLWWISGLNLSNPASVTCVNVLTLADANTLTSMADLMFLGIASAPDTSRSVYILTRSLGGDVNTFVLRNRFTYDPVKWL